MTNKQLIQSLLDYPMDTEVAIAYDTANLSEDVQCVSRDLSVNKIWIYTY